MNVTATAANPALVKIEFLTAAAGEMEITLFDTTDGSEFNVETTFNGSPIQNVKSVSGGKLVVTVIVPTYTWNGTQANWGDADAWEKDGTNATWADGNNARFAADGAEAMLAADVSALSVKFEGSATVSGTAVLAASEISVAAGKVASVLAPVAGILTKTGEGTLSLGASRTEDTTLAGGTLFMAPGATVDASKLTLGVRKDTPVTFDYGGQALSLNFTAISPAGKAVGGNVTLANGDYTVPAALRVWNGSLTITSDTRVTMESSAARWVCVGGNTADTSEASTDIDALLVIDGGSITNNTGNHLGVGDFGSAPSKGAVIVKNGGTYWGKNNIYVAQGCEGHLTIEGERSSATASRLYFCGESRDQVGEDGYVVLSDGGALSVKNVTYNKGNANGYLKFDGGALKAAEAGTLVSAHDRLFVSVAARGGTIDTCGFVVTVEEPILADENSNGGGMKFVGGGTVTLAAGNTYTGTTTVELGTVVKVASASDIGGGFAMTLKDGQQPTDGIYTLVEITGNGTFSNDVLAGVEAPSGGRVELSKSGKSILYFFGYPGFVWIGGASGSLADPTGWANGMVPGASDDCFIGNDVAASLSTASGFAPKSITFTAASAPVTISGDVAISGIAAVTNLSAEVPEIACPLTFAGNYRVHCSSAAVDFSGGVTATYPAPDITDNAPTRALTGTITFTEDWTAAAPMSNMYTVPDGSKLYGKHLTGSVDGKTFLCVKAGGHAEFDSILTGKSLGRVSVQGELVVKGKWVAAATANYSHIGEDNNASETGTLRVSGLWKGDDDHEMNKDLFVKIKNLYIGKDGLGAKRSHYLIRFQASEIGGYLIHATDDFEIFGPLNTSNPTDWGVSFEQPVTLDTAGHKITWTAGAQGEGAVTKTGEGTLVMNPHGSDMTNTWTVAGGTLALAKSAATGTGAIAVNAGATLQVAVSGTVSLGGALSLKNGAALGFNWTEKNIAPVLDLNGKDVTFTADAAKNVVLKLSMASDAISPPHGRRVLTTGGKFAGATITLAPDAPTWVRDYGVDENGNIYVEGGHGFVIKLR